VKRGFKTWKEQKVKIILTVMGMRWNWQKWEMWFGTAYSYGRKTLMNGLEFSLLGCSTRKEEIRSSCQALKTMVYLQLLRNIQLCI